MSAIIASTMFVQSFEGMMLLCFGVSWPVSVYKTWRHKRTEGKSLIFLWLIFIGYWFGTFAKVIKWGAGDGLEAVTALYVLNLVMVGADLVLTIIYRRRATKLPAQSPVEVNPADPDQGR